MIINIVGEWNRLILEGQEIIKNKKLVFGEAKWIPYVKKFNRIIKEKPTRAKIEDLKRIISGLKY